MKTIRENLAILEADTAPDAYPIDRLTIGVCERLLEQLKTEMAINQTVRGTVGKDGYLIA